MREIGQGGQSSFSHGFLCCKCTSDDAAQKLDEGRLALVTRLCESSEIPTSCSIRSYFWCACLLVSLHHSSSASDKHHSTNGNSVSDLVDSVAIAVQRCAGMAWQSNVEMEAGVAEGVVGEKRSSVGEGAGRPRSGDAV